MGPRRSDFLEMVTGVCMTRGGCSIGEVKEVSLSTNQEKSEMKRNAWKVEGDSAEEPTSVIGGPVNNSSLLVGTCKGRQRGSTKCVLMQFWVLWRVFQFCLKLSYKIAIQPN
ncbi:hypothetical protein ACFX1X_027213 [Malus domestica]